MRQSSDPAFLGCLDQWYPQGSKLGSLGLDVPLSLAWVHYKDSGLMGAFVLILVSNSEHFHFGDTQHVFLFQHQHHSTIRW